MYRANPEWQIQAIHFVRSRGICIVCERSRTTAGWIGAAGLQQCSVSAPGLPECLGYEDLYTGTQAGVDAVGHLRR